MKTKIFDNIKKIINSKLCKDVQCNNTDYIRTISDEHGFQLNNSDIGPFIKSRFAPEQIIKLVDNINNYGYLDNEAGILLKQLFDDDNNTIYSKSINSCDVDSIFNEGVRCLGNTTSGFGVAPDSIDKISLENTISIQPELALLIGNIKNNYGISQGFNPIDGTLIINIPKDCPKEELFYFNNESSTYNIKPDFIIGFLPVNENHIVDNFVFQETLIKSQESTK